MGHRRRGSWNTCGSWRGDVESTPIMGFKQWLWQRVPPRIRSLFEDGPETVILSRLPPEQLLHCIQDSLDKTFAPGPGSARGSVIGSTIRIHWAVPWVRDGFEPLFRGKVEAADGGSQIIGCMSHNRFVQAFVAVWCGAVILFSVVLIWTIIMPLAGWGMLWLLSAMLSIGDHFAPDRRERILEHLSTCAERTL